MQKKTLILTSEEVQALPVRERVGLVIGGGYPGSDATTLVKTVVAAEAAGVRQVWSTQSPVQADTLTAFAAALPVLPHAFSPVSLFTFRFRHPYPSLIGGSSSSY